MKLSLRRNRRLVIYCTCMAQTNDQRRKPEVGVPWRFWGWDSIAEIDVTESAVEVFREHVREYDAAHTRCLPGAHP